MEGSGAGKEGREVDGARGRDRVVEPPCHWSAGQSVSEWLEQHRQEAKENNLRSRAAEESEDRAGERGNGAPSEEVQPQQYEDYLPMSLNEVCTALHFLEPRLYAFPIVLVQKAFVLLGTPTCLPPPHQLPLLGRHHVVRGYLRPSVQTYKKPKRGQKGSVSNETHGYGKQAGGGAGGGHSAGPVKPYDYSGQANQNPGLASAFQPHRAGKAFRPPPSFPYSGHPLHSCCFPSCFPFLPLFPTWSIIPSPALSATCVCCHSGRQPLPSQTSRLTGSKWREHNAAAAAGRGGARGRRGGARGRGRGGRDGAAKGGAGQKRGMHETDPSNNMMGGKRSSLFPRSGNRTSHFNG